MRFRSLVYSPDCFFRMQENLPSRAWSTTLHAPSMVRCPIPSPYSHSTLRATPAPHRFAANRVTRNLHSVADVTAIKARQINALFPYAAMINHACKANAFFHAEVVSSSADGPVLEYVLRTTDHINAGDEVLVSYLDHSSTSDVTVGIRFGGFVGGGDSRLKLCVTCVGVCRFFFPC